MNKKVTLQDIADTLGISRNTVSRALNNTGTVSDSTKNKIFQTATEMGYKQFTPALSFSDDTYTPAPGTANEIVLFTRSFPDGSHFCAKLLQSFQKKIGELGYKFSFYIIRNHEINQPCFPMTFNPEHTAGILCLELFSESYTEFLCKQGIPLLFVDTVFKHNSLNLQADSLYMDNQTSVYYMLKQLINKGFRNISFVGDRFHCQSFYERWQTYCAVMADHNLPVRIENNILESDSALYGDADWVTQRIKDLPTLPDVFFCANDYIAISTLRALKQLNISVPDDVQICGFDDSPEASIITPTLSTIRIHSDSMGVTAAELLLSRISHPDVPHKITYVKTDVIYRDSTKI